MGVGVVKADLWPVLWPLETVTSTAQTKQPQTYQEQKWPPSSAPCSYTTPAINREGKAQSEELSFAETMHPPFGMGGIFAGMETCCQFYCAIFFYFANFHPPPHSTPLQTSPLYLMLMAPSSSASIS